MIEAATDAPPGFQLLDHFSIASIARTAMEAGLMMLYVTDPTVDADEFEMRRKVFILHDTCHRSRMFKHSEKTSLEIKSMRDTYRSKIEEIRNDLKEMPNFSALNEETREKILEGRTYYVGGVRGALRSVDWSIEDYESYESYLSGYLHSMPTSFIRADQHKIDFNTISDMQYGLCITCLTLLSKTLSTTTERIDKIINAPG
ncbi:MAG: hypothetical protein ACK40A_14365 [Pannonibacter indicus]